MREQISELLRRQCDAGGGTKVINCVLHMGISITERPDDCRLCFYDLRNHMRTAIAVNEWLNDWKQAAESVLKSLLVRSF